LETPEGFSGNGGLDTKPRTTIRDKLTIILKYLREYRTMDSIAHDYYTVGHTIQWGADTLKKKFSLLPEKRVLAEADVIESPIQRQEEAAYDKDAGDHRTENHENHRRTGSQRQRT
jgi:hypothetical protein